MALELAGFPERPEALCIWRTWDGRILERQVHRMLRTAGRRISDAPGREWFVTSKEELQSVLGKIEPAEFPQDRVLLGEEPSLAEGMTELMAQGSTIEFSTPGDGAAVRTAIRGTTDSQPLE